MTFSSLIIFHFKTSSNYDYCLKITFAIVKKSCSRPPTRKTKKKYSTESTISLKCFKRE